MALRIVCGIVLLASAVYFPIYLTFLIALFCLYRFNTYYELPVIFFIHDTLYGIAEPKFFGFRYVMTIVALLLVFIVARVRKYVFNSNMKLS